MKKFLAVVLVLVSLVGCTSAREDIMGTSQTKAQMRAYQMRALNTTNKDMVLRGVIATMQDLGFVIEKADESLGLISGTSYIYGSSRLAVSVRVVNGQMIVRANAQEGLEPIKEPIVYQNFFDALSQATHLEVRKVQ